MDAYAMGMFDLLNAQPGPGVLDYLRGNASVEDIVQPTDIPELQFIPAGEQHQDTEDLFVRPRLQELLSDLRNKHDFVILDGAPVLMADSAALLVPHVDSVLLVIRPFYTRGQALRQALDMLYQRRAKQVALILNRARAEDLAGRYKHGTNYRASAARFAPE
jgi:Mrp family chromosome partitioning ATPase